MAVRSEVYPIGAQPDLPFTRISKADPQPLGQITVAFCQMDGFVNQLLTLRRILPSAWAEER